MRGALSFDLLSDKLSVLEPWLVDRSSEGDGEAFQGDVRLARRPSDEPSVELYDSRGRPRLRRAERWFLGERDLDFDGLVDFYREWRRLDEYLVLMRKSSQNNLPYERKILAVKCSKRGNDVYQKRVKERFGLFRRLDEDIEFFESTTVEKKTRVIFVTLSYDIGRCEVAEAWRNIGVEFNRWITRLRRKYGKIQVIRTWESFDNGYPHVHCLLVFEDHGFDAWKDLDEDLHVCWRISEKPEFETSWHSFVDVQAARTYYGALKYLQKRVVSGSEKVEGSDLTLAMLWIFRKRAFSVSREFQAALHDLIGDLHNSNVQLTLEGSRIPEFWISLGVFSALELGLDGSRWVKVLDRPPEAAA